MFSVCQYWRSSALLLDDWDGVLRGEEVVGEVDEAIRADMLDDVFKAVALEMLPELPDSQTCSLCSTPDKLNHLQKISPFCASQTRKPGDHVICSNPCSNPYSFCRSLSHYSSTSPSLHSTRQPKRQSVCLSIPVNIRQVHISSCINTSCDHTLAFQIQFSLLPYRRSAIQMRSYSSLVTETADALP
jgi:hypothetical protein